MLYIELFDFFFNPCEGNYFMKICIFISFYDIDAWPDLD